MLLGLLRRAFWSRERKTDLTNFEAFGSLVVDQLVSAVQRAGQGGFLSDAALILSDAVLALDGAGLSRVVREDSVAIKVIAIDQTGGDDSLRSFGERLLLEKLIKLSAHETKASVFISLIDPDYPPNRG